MGSSESYGRDFGIPTGQRFEPGYEGEPPPERRTFWFYLTAGLGALLGAGLFTLIGTVEVDLLRSGFGGFLEGVFGLLLSHLGLIWLAPTVGSFIMLIFRPTRGFATGFLGASAVGILVLLALAVFNSL